MGNVSVVSWPGACGSKIEIKTKTKKMFYSYRSSHEKTDVKNSFSNTSSAFNLERNYRWCKKMQKKMPIIMIVVLIC